MKVQLWSIFSKQLPFYYPRKSKKNIPIHWFLPNACSQWSTYKSELDPFLTWLSSNLSLFPQNTNISAKFVKNYLRTNNTLGSPKFFDFTCKKLFACQSDRVDNQNKRFTVETNKIAEKNKSCKFFKKKLTRMNRKSFKKPISLFIADDQISKSYKTTNWWKTFCQQFCQLYQFWTFAIYIRPWNFCPLCIFSFHFTIYFKDT